MRIAILVCGLIGFILFFSMGLFTAGRINIGVGLFSGVIGGLIGMLLSVPFCYVLRKDAKQAIVDQAEPIRFESAGVVQGLWRLDRNLVIDPETAVFPQRCIFTNEFVSVLRPFTIGDVRNLAAGSIPIVSVKKRVEYLPVSKEWLRSREKVSRIIQRIAIAVFCVGTIASITGWCFTANEKFFVPLSFVCVVGLLISFALHRLSDFGARQELYSSYFLEDGRIIVRDAHPDFLIELPELKAGFLHGFLGIEQLKEVIDHKNEGGQQG